MTSRERSRNVDGSTDLEYQAREESRPGRQPRTRRSGSARARTGGRGDGSTRRDGERLRSAVAGWYGTAATRTICRGERGGEDERESRTCWGEQAECPDRRETRDDRRLAGGKRRVSLGPGDEERLCLAEGGLWPGQVADVADLAAVAAAAAAATRTGNGGRTGDGVYRQCTGRWWSVCLGLGWWRW